MSDTQARIEQLEEQVRALHAGLALLHAHFHAEVRESEHLEKTPEPQLQPHKPTYGYTATRNC